MLQSDFFDNETESLVDLNVIYGVGKHITDKCMIIFSKEIHAYLLANYDCEIVGVVKANAYGHGAVQVASYFESIGIKHFAVACISEAIELRKSNIKGEIIILGYTPVCQKDE